MRGMRWMMFLWPGLPQLITWGSWSGLAAALVAAVVLDVLLAASFGWSELVDPAWRKISWAGFGVFWVVVAFWSARQWRRHASDDQVEQEGFETALNHYLAGDYYQAEQMLEKRLKRTPRDLDARLMLATLLRHAGRPDEALRQLDWLACLAGAEKWDLEMRRERELIAEKKNKTLQAA